MDGKGMIRGKRYIFLSMQKPSTLNTFLAAGYLLFCCCLGLPAQVHAQWCYTIIVGHEMPGRMPVPLSNNAVAGARDGSGAFCYYSFTGIDSTLTRTGIRLNAYKHDGSGWTTLPPVPDTLGKIAAAASTVDNKIYVIGGYHVLPGGVERSSDRVHVFDPETESWLADGAAIPVPIDDHVQAVYRDSLIYVISGWSNTTNVPNVQIYNPALDQWEAGAPVPDNNQYKAFGASGAIAGDTIYYAGGARLGFDFPIAGYLRKGVIDPSDPTQILWSVTEDSNAALYRAAASFDAGCYYALDPWPNVFWYGGSAVTYNYNGLAYNGSGPVEPLEKFWVQFGPDGEDELLSIVGYPPNALPALMDLRGMIKLPTPEHTYVLLGGMTEGRTVEGRGYTVSAHTVGLPDVQAGALDIRPTVTRGPVQVRPESIVAMAPAELSVVDIHGRVVLRQQVSPPANIDLSGQQPGIYHVVLARDGQRWQGRVVVVR